MDIIYVADSFQARGGAELNDAVLLNGLGAYTDKIALSHSGQTTVAVVKDNPGALFIISNFVALPEAVKQALQGVKYVIYEHDHKYLKTRNPGDYPDYRAPGSDIVNRGFYEAAFKVLCQTEFHADILRSNLGEGVDVYTVGGNLWFDETLDLVESLLETEKQERVGIMVSPIPHKNTWFTEKYCKDRGYDTVLIYPMEHELFLKSLAENTHYAFLPLTPETLGRTVVEARMCGCKVIINDRVGARYEPWFELKGKELIDYMRNLKDGLISQFAVWAGVTKQLETDREIEE